MRANVNTKINLESIKYWIFCGLNSLRLVVRNRPIVSNILNTRSRRIKYQVGDMFGSPPSNEMPGNSKNVTNICKKTKMANFYCYL